MKMFIFRRCLSKVVKYVASLEAAVHRPSSSAARDEQPAKNTALRNQEHVTDSFDGTVGTITSFSRAPLGRNKALLLRCTIHCHASSTPCGPGRLYKVMKFMM